MTDTSLPRRLHAGRAVRPNLWWKRPFDVLLGAPALLVALPLILCLAVAVRLEDGGPALFTQERVGLRGERFRMWKLRTMRAGCEQGSHLRSAAEWFTGRADGGPYKSPDDPRVTRVGRLLRRLDLDELPQLYNVVRGEMSLVGPRPAIPYELAYYRPADFQRLTVPPGMTGLWQVSGRDQLSAPEMMELDLRYAREASPLQDLRILGRTLSMLLRAARRC
jgi:lipopolysaccharide/colanic/teichoic acid biosynthesis glycosyltransferase